LSRTECIDEVNNQIKRLSLFNIIFEVWDGAEGGVLAEKLKVYPDLVDDFFLENGLDILTERMLQVY
jgi:hypothetical protein